MKRSRAVTLSLVPAVASWFASCGHPQPPTYQQVCADQNDWVVDDAQCSDVNRARYSGGYFPYHYYYLPYRSGGYPIGFAAVGGSSVAPQGAARVSMGRVVTGGFGSTAHAGGIGE